MDALEVSPFAPTVVGAMGRRRGLVLACVVVLGAAGIAFGVKSEGAATAKATLVVQDPSHETSDSVYSANQASIMRMLKTADAAAVMVNKAIPSAKITGKQIGKKLKITTEENSDQITIAFPNGDAKLAAEVVNDVEKAYEQSVTSTTKAALDLRVKNTNDAASKAYQALKPDPRTGLFDPTTPQYKLWDALYGDYQNALRAQATTPTSGVVQFSPAAVPDSPSKSGVARYGILGVILGLIIGAGLAYLTVNRRPRIENRLEPELLFERPFLAEIPDFTLDRLPSDLPAFDGERSAAAEGFRFAADALQPGQTYAVISATTGDGKSVTVANIAVTAAKSGKRVLAVDGNYDGQGLSWLLGVPTDRPGLAEVLHGDVDTNDAIRQVDQVPGKLFVLPPGTVGGGPARIDPDAAADVIKEVRRRFDLVIIDAPAVLERSAGTVLAKQADASVIVVPFGADIRVTEEFAKRVSLLGIPVLGYFFTRSPHRPGSGKRGGIGGGKSASGSRRPASSPNGVVPNRFQKPSVGSGV